MGHVGLLEIWVTREARLLSFWRGAEATDSEVAAGKSLVPGSVGAASEIEHFLFSFQLLQNHLVSLLGSKNIP